MMPTYRLLQINDSNGDYWIIVSDEIPKNGDTVLPNNYPEQVWEFKKAPCPLPYWGNEKTCKMVIAQSRRVHEGIAEFDLPDELKVDYGKVLEWWRKGDQKNKQYQVELEIEGVCCCPLEGGIRHHGYCDECEQYAEKPKLNSSNKVTIINVKEG